MNRREFCKKMAMISGSMCFPLIFRNNLTAKTGIFSGKEAMFYKISGKENILCQLCPRECLIKPSQRGFCRNRENRNGKLFSVVWGKPVTVDVGPIEKAPLYHFLPGHKRLCLACASCNLRCKYCQNWHISQKEPEELDTYDHTPDEIIEMAEKAGMKSISFTYTEPTAYYEYMFDIASAAKKKGLKASIVSNGFIQKDPMLKLLTVLDAVKIDLKGYSEKFYEDVCFARLKPVLESIMTVKKNGTHLEIVNLMIPTLNDDKDMIRNMCKWIVKEIGSDTPIHFTRFFPNYQLMSLTPTPVKTLEMAHDTASEEGIKFAYVGNVPGHKYNSTFCPSCGKRIIARSHFDVSEINITDGKCSFCGTKIAGIWK
jgi:pyruvate formate lyase activating enzyme